jgi:hypothetical protein
MTSIMPAEYKLGIEKKNPRCCAVGRGGTSIFPGDLEKTGQVRGDGRGNNSESARQYRCAASAWPCPIHTSLWSFCRCPITVIKYVRGISWTLDGAEWPLHRVSAESESALMTILKGE